MALYSWIGAAAVLERLLCLESRSADPFHRTNYSFQKQERLEKVAKNWPPLASVESG